MLEKQRRGEDSQPSKAKRNRCRFPAQPIHLQSPSPSAAQHPHISPAPTGRSIPIRSQLRIASTYLTTSLAPSSTQSLLPTTPRSLEPDQYGVHRVTGTFCHPPTQSTTRHLWGFKPSLINKTARGSRQCHFTVWSLVGQGKVESSPVDGSSQSLLVTRGGSAALPPEDPTPICKQKHK